MELLEQEEKLDILVSYASEKMQEIGYHIEESGYRLYIFDDNYVMVSRIHLGALIQDYHTDINQYKKIVKDIVDHSYHRIKEKAAISS